jgi:two-component system, cell cycle response regulator
MAHRPPQKQSLLKKALRERKVLGQEVLMYQRLMEVMREEHSFEDILKLLILSVTKGLGYDRAGIFMVDWDRRIGQRMIGIDRYGKFEGHCEDLPISSVKGTHWLSDMVHGYMKPFFTNNLRRRVPKKDWERNIDPGVISNSVVPITVGNNKIIGALAVDNLFTQRRLKKSDLASLMSFATQAGLAIESFQLHEKIKDMTIKDGLTGVYNRRYFDNYLPREVLRCRRYKRFLSLLYVDLDHFKGINDLHGHPAGDVVLKHVAGLLVQGLRNVDIVARLGGDEFAVILPEVGPDGAKTVAERLFKSITENPAPLELLGIPGKKIGTSVGVACFSDSMADYKELIKLADESLYQAKTAGRNRVGDLIATDSKAIL